VQNIQIPDDQHAKLTETAIAASYQNVEAMIQANTEKLTDPRESLSEEKLCQSVAVCGKENAQIETRGGCDARESLLEFGKELGFKLPKKQLNSKTKS